MPYTALPKTELPKGSVMTPTLGTALSTADDGSSLSQRYGGRDDQPAPGDDAPRQCRCEAVDCLEIRAHLKSPIV